MIQIVLQLIVMGQSACCNNPNQISTRYQIVQNLESSDHQEQKDIINSQDKCQFGNISQKQQSPQNFKSVFETYKQQAQEKKEKQINQAALSIQKNWKMCFQKRNFRQRKQREYLHCPPQALSPSNSLMIQNKIFAKQFGDNAFIEIIDLPTVLHPHQELYRNISIYEFADTNPKYQNTYQFSDGSIYQGEIIDQKREGKGRLYYADGSIYEGFWLNDCHHGGGKYLSINGDKYEGEFQNGKVEGSGVFQKFNAAVFTGIWRNNKLHGKGKEIWQDGVVYEGDYVNGNKEGMGSFSWSDGSFYQGEFYNNSMQGTGTYIQTSGKKVFFLEIICKYVGEWFQDKMHGTGTFWWPNGMKYFGQVQRVKLFQKYLNHQKQGLGTLEWPNGKKYVGFWHKGKMHGRGIIFDENGNQEEGEWQNGERIQTKSSIESSQVAPQQ